MKVYVVTPVANEAETLERFVSSVLSVQVPGIILVLVYDDFSTDGTPALAQLLASRQGRLRPLYLKQSSGAGSCYLAGLKKAFEDGADCAVEMDAGFSHDPALLPAFVRLVAQGNDCVFSTRFAPGGRIQGLPLQRRLVSRLGTHLANAALGTSLTDMTSGYEAFSRRALERIAGRDFLSARSRAASRMFQTEMRFLLRDLKCAEVPITYSASSSTFSAVQVARGLLILAKLAAGRFA
jgi:dolichol-phosphate mannosyltransferase